MKTIHAMTVRECLDSYKPNIILSGPALGISNAVPTPWAQKSPFLQSLLPKLDPTCNPLGCVRFAPHRTITFYMPQHDDYPDGVESVGRPCGGGEAAAAVGLCSWKRYGLWSSVRREGPQTTTGYMLFAYCCNFKSSTRLYIGCGEWLRVFPVFID